MPANGIRPASLDQIAPEPSNLSDVVLASVWLTMMMANDGLKWRETAPGVWKSGIGRADKVTLLSAAGTSPLLEGLKKLGSGVLPQGFTKETSGGTFDGKAWVKLPLAPDEKIYGLGLRLKGLERRGIVRIRMDHFGETDDHTHAPVPFYLSSKGYGVFVNSARPLTFNIGVGNRLGAKETPAARDRNTDPKWDAEPFSGSVEISADASGLEVYIIEGPELMKVVQRFNLLSGGGALPPKNALGFWHRVRTMADSKEVLSEIDEFKRRGFPLDVLGLEPGWHSKSYPCTYDWNSKLFPDPDGFLKECTKRGVHINLWENPGVSAESTIYKPLLPFAGSHTEWLGMIPDYLKPEARRIYASHHEKTHVMKGVSGYKLDEVDGFDNWLWPDHAQFPSGVNGGTMRQIYGVTMQRALNDMFVKRNQRTMGLVRGTNAGAQPFDYVIYSDHYDHKEFLTALVSTGLCGTMWAPEIRSAKNSEEWIRRMQTSCFAHLAQLNGWADATKPWSYPEVEEASKQTILLRNRLFPYLYTAFAQYAYEGKPVVRPMLLEDVGTETDQFLLGDSLLVAPMFAGQKSRKVRLPKGVWLDFHTGKEVGRGVITVSPDLATIPLFVRSGSVIPMLGPELSIGQAFKADTVALEIRLYGSATKKTMLYDDDGTTFDFRKGAFSWIEIDPVKRELAIPLDKFKSKYGKVRWVEMSRK